MSYQDNTSKNNKSLADNFLIPKGLSEKSISRLKSGKNYQSVINKINIIKLADDFPATDSGYVGDERFQPKNAYDLCVASEHMGQVQYDIDDFRYCKWFGLPINKMITLRRFPYPVTDNIYDRFNQAEPDVSRMVTYTTNDNNKLEDVLSFGYHMKWKELTAEMETAQMQGDQSGFSGIAKTLMKYLDPKLAQNSLRGENALQYDPKHDSNKTYGPVDSLTRTHIRDVGLEFDKKFDLVFEYDLKSVDGRNPEMVMKDIIANVLVTTYNNAKFWPGARYWIGERPSTYLEEFKKYRDVESVDSLFSNAYDDLKSTLKTLTKSGNAVELLKNALLNGITASVGKILDNVGRPSIPMMNSLLSGEPVGYWHVMIGNPYNPTMCMGNLIIEDVQFKFPTERLSYGDFPNKLQVNIQLKPAMDKDAAGIEMMFNMGKQRIYHQPKKVQVAKNHTEIERKNRVFFGNEKSAITKMVGETLDFAGDATIEIVEETINITKKGIKTIDDELTVNSNTYALAKSALVENNSFL